MRLFRRKPPATDAELLARYRRTGEVAVLGELYGRYTDLVFGVSLKYLKHEEDSKDAVMQIFEQLVTSLQKHDVREFAPWLYVTAKNYCLGQLRKRNVHEPFMESDEAVHPEEEDPREAALQLLEKGLDTLPIEQQRCLDLFYRQQRSYQEIADLTGYDLKKVKSYLQNGKRNLKIYVEKYDDRS
ncbi:RNA polymerase sigma-70 factor, ECF subfamily [Catalinimonas alkaloidigena]|uniref:RNA polymerase sigma-70 factor, ECF subfamily n=1 Tax=Catalinimonas alkaloidigena TaxID=1075417 RepID=A0A1G9GPF9_9BACT|nr:sigma-70 family RNA polymerase sigma factor [Catalinimonas alkaloidigena]SDL02547.1 RNA polymerase sigma-70 factor, ECF subfamily [Catalinimonas alkaloidigena]